MSFLLPVSTSAPVKKSGWTLLGFIFIGGLLGGMLGEILTVFSPSEQIQTIFARALSPGINPPLTVDLVLIKVTLGFLFKINLLTILGIFLGIYLYKNI
jgi:hypothetical protein